ncbi:hypothetical protein CDAR_570621 [Caerostris darwini]|uniref:Uncharacterized protein n=1 Tax=Caerostris darwini TaxID=1538125 RepID=A0AAV4TMH0_9ARAC|nr:hypothetical protein CDAR_570621 [Caerostris darwini]
MNPEVICNSICSLENDIFDLENSILRFWNLLLKNSDSSETANYKQNIPIAQRNLNSVEEVLRSIGQCRITGSPKHSKSSGKQNMEVEFVLPNKRLTSKIQL